MDIKSALRKLAAAVERQGLDHLSSRIPGVLREISASAVRIGAKESNIEVESWPDFLNWWNNNRGQNLTYIFMDSYGADSEQVKLVKRLVRDADKHEKDLHEFYRKLRDLASQQMDPQGVPDDESGAGAPEILEDADPVETEVSEDDALDDIALDLD